MEKKLSALLLTGLVFVAWNVHAGGPPPGLVFEYVTSGHICDAYAPNVQGRFIRKRDGVIKNISTDRNIVVSCPIVTELNFGSVDLYITAINQGNSPFNFTCTARLFDDTGFNFQSIKEDVVIDPGFIDGFFISNVNRTAQFDRVDLICTLPPKSAIDLIAVSNNNPV
jgi:hypothetical protein